VDGAGRIRAMTRIVLPLAKPGVVTAVIFTFIQVWNEFVVAETIFNDPPRNRETLTVGINAFVGLYQTQYQYLFVASIIGIVPVVILFAVIECYLVSGLTAGKHPVAAEPGAGGRVQTDPTALYPNHRSRSAKDE
jgi:multiple sugar transport system permease protein